MPKGGLACCIAGADREGGCSIGGGAGALHLMASPGPAGVVEIAVVGARFARRRGWIPPARCQPAQRVVMSEGIFRRCINQDRRLPFINDRISQYPKRV
jgi:hypothetical protein